MLMPVKLRFFFQQSRRLLHSCVPLYMLALYFSLASCQPKPTALPPTLTPPPTPRLPTPTAEPTSHPQNLVVCATEPQAVSPFWSTQSGDDILALFYEPPIERTGYDWEPRLVERVPTLQNGDVMTRVVTVNKGTRYANALGVVQTYDKEEAAEMTQLTVIFKLIEELTWSDGVKITAQDAVLGYHLAQSAEAQGFWKFLAERTSRFFALDEHTLQWEGIPGYLSANYPGFLFPLHPFHRWQGYALPQILQDRTPLATGPFQITAWETNREVRLEPNPSYSGTPPQLDRLTIRFPQVPIQQWGTLIADGTCDVIMPEPAQQIAWRDWETFQEHGFVEIKSTAAPVLLRLDFNLTPHTPSPISQLAVRQGIAACVHREDISLALPGEAQKVAHSFLPPEYLAFDEDQRQSLDEIAFDVEQGESLLTEAGWFDEDNDGIREAHDVPGFTDGQPFSLTLHIAPQYFMLAAHIAANIEACGIDITLLPTEPNVLYSQQEASPLYGRTFEMALFGWQVEIPYICGAWRSDRIPEADNGWQGENFSGFASESYDNLCEQALFAVDPDEQRAILLKAYALIPPDLPTLFLAWRPFWFIARPYVQGLQPDTSTVGAMWNAEMIYIED